MTESSESPKGVVLDTSTLIELLRSNPLVQSGVDSLLDRRYRIATSAACVAELYGGLRSGEESMTAYLIATLECLPLTLSIARRAGEIKVARGRTGRTHGIVDMMIAATALEAGYSIVTENKRDFDIPGLEMINLH